MSSDYKSYLTKQKKEFEDTHHLMTVENHARHNSDPEYWDILLSEIKNNPEKWNGKKALDFGCGCGRNIKNLLDLANWDRVDGCDISKKNADYAKKWVETFHANKTITWETDGSNLQPCEKNTYDFIMSHIVLQHISNYSTRFSILQDIYDCLALGGLASLHYLDLTISNTYYEDLNVYQNCRVENPEYLIQDFSKIGFVNISCVTGIDPFTGLKTYYIKGNK